MSENASLSRVQATTEKVGSHVVAARQEIGETHSTARTILELLQQPHGESPLLRLMESVLTVLESLSQKVDRVEQKIDQLSLR